MNESLRCPKCGHEIDRSNPTCPGCGVQLKFRPLKLPEKRVVRISKEETSKNRPMHHLQQGEAHKHPTRDSGTPQKRTSQRKATEAGKGRREQGERIMAEKWRLAVVRVMLGLGILGLAVSCSLVLNSYSAADNKGAWLRWHFVYGVCGGVLVCVLAFCSAKLIQMILLKKANIKVHPDDVAVQNLKPEFTVLNSMFIVATVMMICFGRSAHMYLAFLEFPVIGFCVWMVASIAGILFLGLHCPVFWTVQSQHAGAVAHSIFSILDIVSNFAERKERKEIYNRLSKTKHGRKIISSVEQELRERDEAEEFSNFD